jgi:hypothetical protein
MGHEEPRLTHALGRAPVDAFPRSEISRHFNDGLPVQFAAQGERPFGIV